MITVLVLAAVTAVIASSFLFRSAQEAKLATRSFFQSAALNLAEAGVEEALFAANTTAFTSANGWSLVSGSTTDFEKTITSGFDFQQATGSIYIRVDNASSLSPTVVAAGVITIPKQPKLVKQIRVGGAAPARIWANGIVAKGNVTFSGSADIDSYNSSLGTWNAATNRSDRATVATNATVQLSGAAYIYGYVATGGATPSVGTSGRIYGATSPATPLMDATRVRTDFNANLADATAPTTTAIALGATYPNSTWQPFTLPRAGDVPGPNGRYLYSCTTLAIGGSSSVTVAGPVDIVVAGNTTIDGAGFLSISSNMTLNPSFNLYCPGAINIGGSGMVNNTSQPIKASIWGTKPAGGTPQVVNVSGAGAFNGTIYAPNADVALTGSGGVFGAVIGNTVTLSGAAIVHYDVQLLDATTSAGPTPSAGNGSGYLRVSSWSELKSAPGSGDAFARDNRSPFGSLF